jgi:hypothetical protein
MRFSVVIVTLGLTFWTAGASAQPISKEAKIERILELTNADAMMDQVFNQMKAMTSSQMASSSTPEQRARAEQTQSQIMDLVRTRMRWDKLRPQYVKLYSETFSDGEIDGMLGFYQSPAGQAVLQKMPVLMGKTMTLVQALMSELMPEIQRIAKEAQQDSAGK